MVADRRARLTRLTRAFDAGWALLRNGQYGRLRSVFAEDVEYVDHRRPGAPSLRGYDALRRTWEQVLGAFDIQARVIDLLDDDRVLTAERYAPKTGGEAIVTFGVYTLRDGRIARGDFFASQDAAREAATAHAGVAD